MKNIGGYAPFAKITNHKIQLQKEGIQILESYCSFQMQLFLIGLIGKQTNILQKIMQLNAISEQRSSNIIWISLKSRRLTWNMDKQFIALEFTSTNEEQIKIVNCFLSFLCSVVLINEVYSSKSFSQFQLLQSKCKDPSKLIGQIYFLDRKGTGGILGNVLIQNQASFLKYLGQKNVREFYIPQDEILSSEDFQQLESQINKSCIKMFNSNSLRTKIRFGPQLVAYAQQLSLSIQKATFTPQQCIRDMQIGQSYAAYLQGAQLFNKRIATSLKDSVNVPLNQLNSQFDSAAEEAYKKFIDEKGNSIYLLYLKKHVETQKRNALKKINAEKNLKDLQYLTKKKDNFEKKIKQSKKDEKKMKEEIDSFMKEYNAHTDGEEKHVLATKVLASYLIDLAKQNNNGQENKMSMDKIAKLQQQKRQLQKALALKSDKCCLLM